MKIIAVIQLIPKVLSRIQVLTLCRPIQSFHFIVIIPIHRELCNVVGDVVILEVTIVQPVKLAQCRKDIVH